MTVLCFYNNTQLTTFFLEVFVIPCKYSNMQNNLHKTTAQSWQPCNKLSSFFPHNIWQQNESTPVFSEALKGSHFQLVPQSYKLNQNQESNKSFTV